MSARTSQWGAMMSETLRPPNVLAIIVRALMACAHRGKTNNHFFKEKKTTIQ